MSKVAKETKKEEKSVKLNLEPGEKIKVAKGDSPHHDRTETAPGINEGKKGKFGV